MADFVVAQELNLHGGASLLRQGLHRNHSRDLGRMYGMIPREYVARRRQSVDLLEFTFQIRLRSKVDGHHARKATVITYSTCPFGFEYETRRC